MFITGMAIQILRSRIRRFSKKKQDPIFSIRSLVKKIKKKENLKFVIPTDFYICSLPFRRNIWL